MGVDVSLSFAALTAIAGALLGAGLTYLNAVRQKSNDAASTKWKSDVERRSNQLGTLYAPLKMLRSQSTGLRGLLPSTEPDGERWRLVHHAGSIGKAWRDLQGEIPVQPRPELGLSNDQIEAAHLLIKTGDDVCELIDANAGLIDGGDPGGFREYKDHHIRLRTSWDTGIDQSEGQSDPFQGKLVGLDDQDGTTTGSETRETSIDVALGEDMTLIRTEYESLLKSGPTVSGTTFGIGLTIVGLGLFAVIALPAILEDSDDLDTILVTTPSGALCGEPQVDENAVVSVGGTVVPAGSTVEFVEKCE